MEDNLGYKIIELEEEIKELNRQIESQKEDWSNLEAENTVLRSALEDIIGTAKYVL